MKKKTRIATVNAAHPSFLSKQGSLGSPALSRDFFFTDYDSHTECLSRRALGRASELRRRLDLNDVVLDRIDNQIADGVQAKFPHNVTAMCLHGLSAQVQG